MKIAVSIILGLLIGGSCRWFAVPVPAPPTLIGALLVLSITVGYVAVDYFIPAPPQQNGTISGGPAGEPDQAPNRPQ
jgi:XapX domain-containing protein